VRRTKGGRENLRQILPVRVRARTELPARTQHFSAGVRSQGGIHREVRKKEPCRRGQAGRSRGVALRLPWRVRCRPYAKRWRGHPDPLFPAGYAVTDGEPLGVLRAITWEKWFGVMTGERSTPSERSVTPSYKPQAKGKGPCGGAEGLPNPEALGTAADPEYLCRREEGKEKPPKT